MRRLRMPASGEEQQREQNDEDHGEVKAHSECIDGERASMRYFGGC